MKKKQYTTLSASIDIDILSAVFNICLLYFTVYSRQMEPARDRKKLFYLSNVFNFPNCWIRGISMKPKKGSTYRTSLLSEISGDRGIYE